jgi:hypothetical protein
MINERCNPDKLLSLLNTRSVAQINHIPGNYDSKVHAPFNIHVNFN